MRETTARTSTSAVGPRSRAHIEEELRRLDGVRHASIDRGAGGRLGRVHVTTDADWLIEAVRQDVAEMLQQRFGLRVPARMLDVRPDDTPRSAPADDPTPPPRVAPAMRLELDTVHLALRSQGTSVGVDLLDDGERLRGTAGPVGPAGVLTGVVDATIDALRRRVDHQLESVVAEVVEAGGDQLAIATLTASDGRSRQRLTGSALVRGSVEDAMARAALDATNRLVAG